MTKEGKKIDGRSRPKKFKVDRDWFYKKYSIDMVPTRLIAEEIGCVNEHVNAIAKKLGIPVRPRLPRSVPHPTLDLDVDEIVRLYIEEEMSCANIGKRFGCSHKAISSRLKERGIKLRHHNDTKRGKPARNKIIIDPDLVVSMYLKKYASGQTVADHFGVSRQVIDRILAEQGVEKKPMREARNMWGENGPNWRHDLTQEDRESRRDTAKQREWREKIFSRDGYTCQKCGDSRGGNLHAHHIIPHYRDKSIAWEIDNGITFCETCHTEFHKTYGFKRCNRETLGEFLAEAVCP